MNLKTKLKKTAVLGLIGGILILAPGCSKATESDSPSSNTSSSKITEFNDTTGWTPFTFAATDSVGQISTKHPSSGYTSTATEEGVEILTNQTLTITNASTNFYKTMYTMLLTTVKDKVEESLSGADDTTWVVNSGTVIDEDGDTTYLRSYQTEKNSKVYLFLASNTTSTALTAEQVKEANTIMYHTTIPE